MKRADDYAERREHLASLSDEALKDRFWALLDQLTDPPLVTAQIVGHRDASLGGQLRQGEASHGIGAAQ